MMELHVWGTDGVISVISPECLASSWLLNLQLTPQKVPFKIVTSSNTNLADSGVLPLLIGEDGSKHEGFERIADHISKKYPGSTRLVSLQDSKQKLTNASLMSYINNKIRFLNQYNLYINTKNYEGYTRKLFQHYFPFPMMYNQPLKFYHTAQDQVRIIGLNINKVGFFSVSGTYEDQVAETEYFNQDIDDVDGEVDEVAISALHEKQLISKSKKKSILREAKNSLKCLNLVNEYLTDVILLGSGETPAPDFSLFEVDKLSTSELLLYAYIYTLTYSELPDGFIRNYIAMKFPEFSSHAFGITEELNQGLVPEIFRGPVGDEVPSLYNEIKYCIGYTGY